MALVAGKNTRFELKTDENYRFKDLLKAEGQNRLFFMQGRRKRLFFDERLHKMSLLIFDIGGFGGFPARAFKGVLGSLTIF